jgi:hypothetical protein
MRHFDVFDSDGDKVRVCDLSMQRNHVTLLR